MQILFVDDNADMCGMMSLLLQRRGHSVTTAASGTQALEVARQCCPDVVLSDISMPGMNGYEFVAALRAQSEKPFGAIALSGYCSLEDRARAREAGFDECLGKPVNLDALCRTVEMVGTRIAIDGLKKEPVPPITPTSTVSSVPSR
ncbi:MAG TPA: response regulator [Abditibacteriaceae bacterium]|jgi:hypothetical protein